jgi:D-alanyl-D-alanine carboxypeptidase
MTLPQPIPDQQPRFSGITLAALILRDPPTLNDSEQEALFDTALERFQKHYELPGITTAYVLPNGESCSATAGWSDVEAGQPTTIDSRLLAASIGKTFVAATMVSLAGAASLDLDAPLSEWFSKKVWFERLRNHQRITIRQLLYHTSGLPNYVQATDFPEAQPRQSVYARGYEPSG